MVIALDFDRTLFDTDSDIGALTERGVADRVGDPRVNEIVDPAPYLYPDVVPFLTANDGHTCYIVSAVTERYGSLASEYQADKIRRTGIAVLVTDVILTGQSKVDALKRLMELHPGDPLVFVDDRVDVLTEVRGEIPGIVCIHMVRPGAKRMGEGELPIGTPTVSDLDGVRDIIAHI